MSLNLLPKWMTRFIAKMATKKRMDLNEFINSLAEMVKLYQKELEKEGMEIKIGNFTYEGKNWKAILIRETKMENDRKPQGALHVDA